MHVSLLCLRGTRMGLRKQRSDERGDPIKEEPIMLEEVHGLHGATIHALDGEIGRVDDILFDDKQWTVRYLLVETGGWLTGQKVLISPMAFGSLDWAKHTLNLNLTCEQIKNSPSAETDKPVSRQWERDYYDYYAWPYYWGGMGSWGTFWYPGELFTQSRGDLLTSHSEDDYEAKYHADTNLRSTKEVTGYKIAAIDGHLGHVKDFLVNDDTWRISYLGIDTRDWWPGKKVLLAPQWIEDISWGESKVFVNLSRDKIRQSPEYTETSLLTRDLETRLHRHYDRKGYWMDEPVRKSVADAKVANAK